MLVAPALVTAVHDFFINMQEVNWIIARDLLAPDYRYPNWNLKEVILDEATHKSDSFDSFGLGGIRFVNTDIPDMCLAIDERDF